MAAALVFASSSFAQEMVPLRHAYGQQPLRLHVDNQATQSFLLANLTNDTVPQHILDACQSVGLVSVVIGRTFEGGIIHGNGSCTYLGDGIWLTNRHVVEEGTAATVLLKSGEKLQARVTSKAQGVDCAIVETINVDDRVKIITIADEQPTIGDIVYPSGYDFSDVKKHVVWPSRIVSVYDDGHINSIGTGRRKGSISGNSGGPTFTSKGELIAPLWGTQGEGNVARNGSGTTMTCCWLRTRTFLLPWRERVMRSIQTQCQGGQCYPQPQRMYQQPIPQQYQQPQSPVQTPVVPSFKPPETPTPAPTVAPPVPGPKGDKGDKGDPGTVSDQQIRQIISEIKTAIANDASFRGPPGEPGQVSQQQISQIIAAIKSDPSIRAKQLDQLKMDEFGNIVAVYSDGSRNTLGNIGAVNKQATVEPNRPKEVQADIGYYFELVPRSKG